MTDPKDIDEPVALKLYRHGKFVGDFSGTFNPKRSRVDIKAEGELATTLMVDGLDSGRATGPSEVFQALLVGSNRMLWDLACIAWSSERDARNRVEVVTAEFLTDKRIVSYEPSEPGPTLVYRDPEIGCVVREIPE